MRTIPNVNEDADLGITWSTEEVMQKGVVVCTHAQIPVMTDVPTFHEAFPHFIPAMSNGSSLRVQAQAVCRRMSKDDPAAQRAAILNAIRGLRNSSRSIVTVEKIVEKKVVFIPTPDGEVVQVDLAVPAEALAALVDAGYDVSTAQNIVRKMVGA